VVGAAAPGNERVLHLFCLSTSQLLNLSTPLSAVGIPPALGHHRQCRHPKPPVITTLSRHVLARVGGRFIALFLAFVGVFLGGQFTLIMAKGIPPEACLPVLESTLLLAVSLALPLGLTTAILLVCGALARDGEIRALAAGGISHLRVLRALAPLVLAGVIGSAVLAHVIMPQAMAGWRENQGRLFKAAVARYVAKREAIPIEEAGGGQVRIWARAVAGNTLSDLYLVQRDGDHVLTLFSPTTQWTAGPQGLVLQAPKLHLLRMPAESAVGAGADRSVLAGEIAGYTSWPISRSAKGESESPDGMPTAQVLALVRAGPSADPKQRNVYNNARLSLHLRLFLPLSIVVFALLAAGIGLTFAATDNLIGVLLVVALVALSALPAIQYVKTQVDHPHASPGWLLWPPALVCLLTGIWLCRDPLAARRHVDAALARLRWRRRAPASPPSTSSGAGGDGR